MIKETAEHYDASNATTVGTVLFTPGDSNIVNGDHAYNISGGYFATANTQMIRIIDIMNGSRVLAEKDIKTTIKLENVYYTHLIEPASGSNFSAYYDYNLIYKSLLVIYASGSSEYIDVTAKPTANSFYYNLTSTFTPKDDIVGLRWQLRSSLKDDTGYSSSAVSSTSSVKITAYIGERNPNDYNLSIIQPSEEETLLGGIWDSLSSGFSALGSKLTDVWSSITNGFTEMGNKLSSVITSITDGFKNMGNVLTDVWNSIKELPSKLWALIEEGLTNLFVPSEESMEEFKTKFETMLEEKYGAVWEVVQITFGSWENINASDLKNTISVPKVEIPLPDDNSFSFGGKEVKVIPSGFEPIAEICKMMSGAFCTLMFINGLRKRYDEVMAVEK